MQAGGDDAEVKRRNKVFHAAVLSLVRSKDDKIDKPLFINALLEGFTEQEIRDSARQVKKQPSLAPIEETVPNEDWGNNQIASFQKAREVAIEDEATLKDLIKQGKVAMMKCTLEDYHDRNQHEKVEMTSETIIGSGSLNSSYPPTMMCASAVYCERNAKTAINSGGPAFHAHPAPMHANMNHPGPISMASIQFSEEVQSGQKPFASGDFTNRTPAKNAEIDMFWQTNNPDGTPQVSTKVPIKELRDTQAYQNAQLHIESLPSVEELIERTGPERFSKDYSEPARDANMHRSGITYLRRLSGVATITPGNLLQDKVVGTRPHFADKKMRTAGDTARIAPRRMKQIKKESTRPPAKGIVWRVSEVHKKVKAAFKRMKDTPPEDRYEEGKNCILWSGLCTK